MNLIKIFKNVTKKINKFLNSLSTPQWIYLSTDYGYDPSDSCPPEFPKWVRKKLRKVANEIDSTGDEMGKIVTYYFKGKHQRYKVEVNIWDNRTEPFAQTCKHTFKYYYKKKLL